MCTCMHEYPKRQLAVSMRSEKEVGKTGNPVNRKNPILNTNPEVITDGSFHCSALWLNNPCAYFWCIFKCLIMFH